jgi:cytochrome P450
MNMDDWFELGVEEPQGVYARMAADGAKTWERGIVLTRMDDILELNRSRDVVGEGGSGPSFGSPRPVIPLDLDGPEHTKYRKLLDPVFSARSVASLAPAIRRLTNELIDGFVDRGQTELFSELCVPLPSRIFLDFAGLPQSDLDFLIRYKQAAIRPEGDTMEEREAYRNAVGGEMSTYLYELLAERRRSRGGGDDLFSRLLAAEVDGHTLGDDEIVDIFFLLVVAGLDTVTSSLSCIFSWLARHPAERARVVADPAIVPAAVEELMRFESPVFTGHRWAVRPIEIAGHRLEPGQEIAVVWASANLDPDHFPDPLTVDFDRPANRHIGFASGFHRCLGSHLARLELYTVVEELHRRIPDYWITPGDEPRYLSLGVRAVEHLPISFPPGGGATG